jgi:hypothetical protein
MAKAADSIIEPEVMTGAGGIIAAGGALQQMRTGYAISVRVQVPRDLELVASRCLAEAKLAGEAVFFGWGSGKNRVEGATIDCATLILRNWTNAACEVLSVEDNPREWIFHCGFVDLETGVTFTKPFLQSKSSQIFGNLDTARATSSRFAQGASKGMRNVILKAVPVWLVEQVVEAGKSGALAKLEQFIKKNNIEAARQKVLKGLLHFGAKAEDIERKTGKEYGEWDKYTLIDLGADFKAIKNGDISIVEAFPPEKAEAPEGSLKDKLKKKADGDAATPDVDKNTGEITEKPEASGTDSPEPAQPEQSDDEPPPAEKGPPEKEEATPPEKTDADKPAAPPAEESTPAQPSAPPKTTLATLMAMTRDDLNNLALERMMQATDAGVMEDQFADFADQDGTSPFAKAMIKKGTLRNADVTDKANNRAHVARLIMKIEQLIAQGPQKTGQGEFPY